MHNQRNQCDSKQQWNKLVLENSGSFLQSWEWGELQEKLGRQVLRVAESDVVAQVLKYKLPLKQSYFYAPRGVVSSKLKVQSEKLNTLVETIKKYDGKPIFLRIEPDGNFDEKEMESVLKKAGFIKTKSVQPEKTIIVDLKKSEEELLKSMEHDTRYAIRTAEKRGVNVQILEKPTEKGSGFDDFYRLFNETNKRHDLAAYPKKYYEEIFNLSGDCQSKIFLAQIDGKTIASAIILFFGNTATYLYAASEQGYGKYNAPTLLLWQAMLNAKKSGCENFDLFGISDDKTKWQGLTAFKKSFGGAEKQYVGTWDYVFDKKKYLIYKLIKKIR